MKTNRVEIRTEGIKTIIKIDGQEIYGVKSYNLNRKAGEIGTLTLGFNELDSEISIDDIFIKEKKR